MREDFKRLVSTINNTAGEAKLEVPVLDSVFEMWWPRLEEQVTEILKTHGKGVKADRRSDRDILEEVLQLSRINSERAHRPSRVSPRAMMELVENLSELAFITAREHGDMGLTIMERIDRPIRHMCIEAGVPEIYERYQMRMRQMLPRHKTIEESAEQIRVSRVP